MSVKIKSGFARGDYQKILRGLGNGQKTELTGALYSPEDPSYISYFVFFPCAKEGCQKPKKGQSTEQADLRYSGVCEIRINSNYGLKPDVVVSYLQRTNSWLACPREGTVTPDKDKGGYRITEPSGRLRIETEPKRQLDLELLKYDAKNIMEIAETAMNAIYQKARATEYREIAVKPKKF